MPCFWEHPRVGTHLFDLWTKGQNREPDWASWQFTTMDGGNVPPEEIEAARRDLDELTFSAEYLADFVSFEGRAHREFQRSTHCAPLEYNPRAPLVVSGFMGDSGISQPRECRQGGMVL
jgi:hypothetical protein